MNNTILFDFPFVNRNNERNLIKNYRDASQRGDILWLCGASGCGKTTLLKEVLDNKIDDTFCIYINQDPSDSSGNYIKNLLKVLQKVANIKLRDFIKIHYTSIFKGSKILIIYFFKRKGIDISDFADYLYDQTTYIIDLNQKKQTADKVLDSYIQYIIEHHNKKLIIVLDDISKLDINTQDILINLIQRHVENKHVRFILVTSKEDKGDNDNLEKIIYERIPVNRLELFPFCDITYFYNILNKSFDIKKEDYKFIELIFKICDGNPEKLKEILRYLLNAGAIQYDISDNKAQFEWTSIDTSMLEQFVEFSLESYRLEERIILIILSVFGISIPLPLLCELNSFVIQKLFKWLPANALNPEVTIMKLKEIDLIEINPFNELVSIRHDLISFSINQKIDKKLIEIPKSMWSGTFLHFIKTHNLKNSISIDDYAYLYCLHAYQSSESNWEKINFGFGSYLCRKKKFANAYKFFNQLLSSKSFCSSKQNIIIAHCCYELGYYDQAAQLIDSVDIQEISIENRYFAYYIMAKIYNMVFRKEDALLAINNSISLTEPYSEANISAVNIKHFLLWEMGGQKFRSEAHKIYYKYVNYFRNNDQPCASVAKLYRTCSDYYRGNDVIELLNKATIIARTYDDEYEYACCNNNLGFEYFRQGNITQAIKLFDLAIEILTRIKPHEVSYAQNNRAVIDMLCEDYYVALDKLLSASIINCSPYAGLTIAVNLSICYALLGKKKEAYTQLHLLQENEYFIQNTDPTVIRKCHNAMAFVYDRFSDEEACRYHCCVGLHYSKNTFSIDKISKIASKYLPDVSVLKKSENLYTQYCSSTPYDHWLLTYSHD